MVTAAQTARRMGRPPNPVIAARNNAIVALAKLGARADEIAVQMQVTTGTVHNLLSMRRRTASSKPPRRNTAWNDRMIADLRRLWGTDNTTVEIGRMMGMNKNQIIGKAHYIGLPARRRGAPRRA